MLTNAVCMAFIIYVDGKVKLNSFIKKGGYMLCAVPLPFDYVLVFVAPNRRIALLVTPQVA